MKKIATIRARTIHILILAALFFVSGLAFFLVRMTGESTQTIQPTVGSISEERGSQAIPSLAHFPAPETFQQVTYSEGKTDIFVSGVCKDSYRVILIFSEKVDYRVSPLDARYNIAAPCSGTMWEATIPLAGLPLVAGERYYVVRAHQGDKGGWYDAY